MSSATEGHRHAVVTPDDHGPVLNIVAWFLMVTMILATLLKLAIRAATRVVGLDDAFSTLAMLFGVGQVVAISIGVNDGLGTRAKLLTESDIKDVEQATFAASLLYVFAIAFAKTSIVFLMSRLFVEAKYKMVSKVLLAVMTAWAIGAIFAVAFQCGLPNPWAYVGRSCADMRPLWYAIGVFDILTDIALIVLPTMMVMTLQMNSSRKTMVVSVFFLRVFVIGAQIARLVLVDNSDPTYPIGFWIATQVQIAVTVIASCAPALKPFMTQTGSGMMAVSLENKGGTYNVSGSYNMQDLPSKTRGSDKGAMSKDSRKNRVLRSFNLSPNSTNHQATASGTMDGAIEGDYIEDDSSDKNIIRKTVGYEVQYSQN